MHGQSLLTVLSSNAGILMKQEGKVRKIEDCQLNPQQKSGWTCGYARLNRMLLTHSK